jgi:hypothetical protein
MKQVLLQIHQQHLLVPLPPWVDTSNYISFCSAPGIHDTIPELTNKILSDLSNFGLNQWIHIKQQQERHLPQYLLPHIKFIIKIIKTTIEKRKEAAIKWTESGVKPIIYSIKTIKHKMEELATSRISRLQTPRTSRIPKK